MMHRKECVNKLRIQALPALRVLVFFTLLLVSMALVLNTARAAVVSAKGISSSVHSARPFSTTSSVHRAASADSVPPTSFSDEDATSQATDVDNLQPENDDNDQDQKTDSKDGDVSKVINVDDDTSVVIDKDGTVILFEDCEKEQNNHKNHREHHEEQHEEHHHNHHNHNNNNNNNNHSFASSVVAGGGGGVGPGGGYPSMPFTGGDPRPLMSK